MKKYMDVVRHGKSSTHAAILKGAENIIIQEKLDGVNASFKMEDGQLKFFSRTIELDEHNTLRGFTTWGMKHLPSLYIGFTTWGMKHLPSLSIGLKDRFIFFGEWLVKHKVAYDESAMGQFYLFDVFDTVSNKYLSFDLVESAAKELHLNVVPVFYWGPFQSIEHIQSFVGQSKLGAKGEGVVVKNVAYVNKHGHQLFTKFVSKEFTEVMQTKEHVIKAPVNELQVFAEQTVTKARVEKIIHKLVDEGHLAEDFAIEQMKDILKHVGPKLVEDVVKEELDILLKMLKGRIGRLAPVIVKEVLKEMGRM